MREEVGGRRRRLTVIDGVSPLQPRGETLGIVGLPTWLMNISKGSGPNAQGAARRGSAGSLPSAFALAGAPSRGTVVGGSARRCASRASAGGLRTSARAGRARGWRSRCAQRRPAARGEIPPAPRAYRSQVACRWRAAQVTGFRPCFGGFPEIDLGPARGGGESAASGERTRHASATLLRRAVVADGRGGRLPRASLNPLIAKVQSWMAGAAGFEPAHGGTKNRCLTAWLRPNAARR